MTENDYMEIRFESNIQVTLKMQKLCQLDQFLGANLIWAM